MKKVFLLLTLVILVLCFIIPLFARQSDAAFLEHNGQALCKVTVYNSQNPTVYPDGVYYFDWEGFMIPRHLFCNSPVPGWTYIGTWMGV